MGVGEAIILSSMITAGVGMATRPGTPDVPKMPKPPQPSQTPAAKRAINPDMAALFKRGAGINTTPSGLTTAAAPSTAKTALGG